MSSTAFESAIDELYQGPLNAFVASRSALAKTLKGAEAQRVKALVKPTLVPWAVNQVYWHARALYDRLMQSGEQLRGAQVAALEGRKADVRAAVHAHREAVSRAAAKALAIAAAAGAHPNIDEIGRTFETLSLSKDRPEHPGRLTGALAPAGFEALGGIAVKAPVPPPAPQRLDPDDVPDDARGDVPLARAAESVRERKQIEAARQVEAARQKQKIAAIKKAETQLAQARASESQARARWEDAKRSLDAAERTLKGLREAD